MPRNNSKRIMYSIGYGVLLAGALLLTGCSGSKGDTGSTGPAGPSETSTVDLSTMTAEQQAQLGTVRIATDTLSISISNTATTVTFELLDDIDRPVLGLDSVIASGDDRAIRFAIAKLVTGSGGTPDYWYNYVVSTSGSPTADAPRSGGILVANDDNTYTYTFASSIAVGSNAVYDSTVTHRLAGQVGGSTTGFTPSNFVYDFVPNGSTVTNTRDIVATASCNECHDPLTVHGSRTEIGYCVTCHNPSLSGGEGDMANMTHKIHAGGQFTAFDEGASFAEVTYPQDLRNCLKCHNGDDTATPQGDNWKTVQSANLCFNQCHSVPAIVLEKAAFHKPTTGNCAACHNGSIVDALDVESLHATANATENNPSLLPGERKIEYKFDSANLNGSSLLITFRILSDGAGLNPAALPSDLSSSPSFIFAYALPQDGINQPTDFNNLGKEAGQPQSISISNLANGSAGALTFADGTCTATIPNPFPAGATMRTVGLQGYYTQTVSGVAVPLHTMSVLKTIAGDTSRRAIANSAGCASCHEIFEGHGGNRVFTADGGVDICTMCHNPDLSSSGRAITAANAALGTAATDIGNTDTLTWPEATNNFKDMIHGIHASAFRSTDYEFVRNRTNGLYYNWSEVTFPGKLANCTKCHLGDSFLPDQIPETSLMTTDRTTGVYDGMDATPEAVTAARKTVPNITDWVITPITAACYACHDDSAVAEHMKLNGGAIDVSRDSVETIDTCKVCHGPGSIADVEVEHGL